MEKVWRENSQGAKVKKAKVSSASAERKQGKRGESHDLEILHR